MKKTGKKSIIISLVALMQMGALVACSSNDYDKNYAIYDLWINGVKVTTRNQKDILGDGTVRYQGDGKSGVLTLCNASLDKAFDLGSETGVIISGVDDLTLQLVGENKIGAGEETPVNGVVACDLTITGEGSLAVGARASCITAYKVIVESGDVDTYIKTTDADAMQYLGVGIWGHDILAFKGGDVDVHFSTSMMAYSYGVYCTNNILVDGGNLTISQEEAPYLSLGLIASEKITIASGKVSAYGLDDAINAKYFEMTGGAVDALALDFSTDGVCRLVYGAKFTGGEMTISYVQRINPTSVTLVSNEFVADGVDVFGGENADALQKMDAQTYTFTDSYIRIAKE